MSPDYKQCPSNIVHSIEKYVTQGYKPGGFLTAVLQNDLTSAVMLADKDNLVALPHIVAYVYHKVPSNCWGSKDRVNNWLTNRAAA